MNKKKYQKYVIIIIIVLAFTSLVWFLFNKKQSDQFATKFYDKQRNLQAVSEEEVESEIEGYCGEKRKEAAKLFTIDEMIEAVKIGTGTLEFVGREEYFLNIDNDYVLLDIQNKEVKLECFNFDKRVIVQGEGQIEIAYSNFQNIKANAIGILDGRGSIHHNKIVGAEKSGIYVDNGEFEIYKNIIKDNLSYGIYGGVEAKLDIYENYISDNGGYEVRLLSERQVWE
ncbi:MAG: right-handed parallel beta-helix repeat-containing protein [Patescibacteria group bacterium]|jgi:hypothetical protein|nr:right-handed parallel beta-helix repeat-containing protein [Patescibacteria group bacterium]